MIWYRVLAYVWLGFAAILLVTGEHGTDVLVVIAIAIIYNCAATILGKLEGR